MIFNKIKDACGDRIDENRLKGNIVSCDFGSCVSYKAPNDGNSMKELIFFNIINQKVNLYIYLKKSTENAQKIYGICQV